MVKFFMQYYNIPTKKDIDKLIVRMDRLENVIRSSELFVKRKSASNTGRSTKTSYDVTLEVIKRFRSGVGFSEIKARTGFGEKKLRNIIYRLNKKGKIVRKKRGFYIAC